MSLLPILTTALLLFGLTLRSIWRNDVELGIAAAALLALFLFIPTPRILQPWMIVAWLVCVWPWGRRHA